MESALSKYLLFIIMLFELLIHIYLKKNLRLLNNAYNLRFLLLANLVDSQDLEV